MVVAGTVVDVSVAVVVSVAVNVFVTVNVFVAVSFFVVVAEVGAGVVDVGAGVVVPVVVVGAGVVVASFVVVGAGVDVSVGTDPKGSATVLVSTRISSMISSPLASKSVASLGNSRLATANVPYLARSLVGWSASTSDWIALASALGSQDCIRFKSSSASAWPETWSSTAKATSTWQPEWDWAVINLIWTKISDSDTPAILAMPFFTPSFASRSLTNL
mmetsp:Transcript_29290/g.74276  ORF Transcript_29290/g.74276 Transcript_29290/m.74276 type:complete len:218 (+) Transcript_29290:605-1258(+)